MLLTLPLINPYFYSPTYRPPIHLAELCRCVQRRSLLEASLRQVEIELESVRVQLEEEAEARLDLERQLVKANGEISLYKSKYESEAQARAEEVEELR